jgi:hypothetical protein
VTRVRTPRAQFCRAIAAGTVVGLALATLLTVFLVGSDDTPALKRAIDGLRNAAPPGAR